jgi:hypothetical protein
MLVSKRQFVEHGLVLIQELLISTQRHEVHESSGAPKPPL